MDVNRSRLWQQVDEALSPSNVRVFDGDNNAKKGVDIKTCIVSSDKGAPTFVLEAKIPRSSVNNLGLAATWSTNARTEAAAFLRALADKIEACT